MQGTDCKKFMMFCVWRRVCFLTPNSLTPAQSHHLLPAFISPQKRRIALPGQLAHAYQKSSPLTLRGRGGVNNAASIWIQRFRTRSLSNGLAGIGVSSSLSPEVPWVLPGCSPHFSPPLLSPSKWELCSTLYIIVPAELEKKPSP